jgi:AcrR family transcriptional regulator
VRRSGVRRTRIVDREGYGRSVTQEGSAGGRGGRRAGLVQGVRDAIRVEGPAASIDDLARVAGVPKSVLYNHFADKDGLLAAVGDAVADEWCDRLRAASSIGAESGRGRAALEAFVTSAETEPHLYDLVRPGADRRASSDRVRRIGARIVAALAPDQPDAAAVIASAVGGAVFAAVDRSLLEDTTGRDQLIDDLLAFLRGGLALSAGPATA